MLQSACFWIVNFCMSIAFQGSPATADSASRGAAPPPPSGAPAPPPPPPPSAAPPPSAPSKSVAPSAGAVSALLEDINRGADVTKGNLLCVTCVHWSVLFHTNPRIILVKF